MRLILALLISLSFPATAQVYKWTDENGNTHFGAQPPPGKQQQVEIRDNSARHNGGAESDILRQSRALERRNQQKAYERAGDRYRDRVEEVRSDYGNSPDYLCTGAENSLKSAQERWDQQQTQGWTISEKRYHEQRIKDAERHRNNICR
ncbi:MAG: DUF4124 domain-containing protein [Marinobacter sp.]